jgi:hypothetical protein
MGSDKIKPIVVLRRDKLKGVGIKLLTPVQYNIIFLEKRCG